MRSVIFFLLFILMPGYTTMNVSRVMTAMCSMEYDIRGLFHN